MKKEIKTLRLLITEKCNRNCPGCCNNQWNLNKLDICNSFKPYNEIILTGGEPMLKPHYVKSIIQLIRKENQCPIYMYTAKVDNIQESLSVLFFLDGITVTIHDKKDWDSFSIFNKVLPTGCRKSLRLNVFKECNLPSYKQFIKWKIKDSMEWIENCPLPTNEVFMKYI